jgi:hypothetical protein
MKKIVITLMCAAIATQGWGQQPSKPASPPKPAAPAAAPITPLPYVVPTVVEDCQEAQVPDRVQLNGMLGARIHANTTTRLLETVDVDRLLEGYRERPGCMTWDGEHIGKYLHAASLAWANSGDEKLRAKIASAEKE